MRCLCFHKDLTNDDIDHYETRGTLTWAIYRQCPVHNNRAASPLVEDDEAGVIQTPAT